MGGKHHGGTGRKTEENKKYKIQKTENSVLWWAANNGPQQPWGRKRKIRIKYWILITDY